MLVIFATHPIQYQVPLWQKMTEAGVDLEVWYFTDFGIKESFDIQFSKTFSWDLPMLEGYKHRFLKANENASPNKGFRGIILKESVKKKLKEHNVTHVYLNGWQVIAYWQVLWAAKSLGLTTIFKGESNDLKPENKWIWPIKFFFLNNFFKKIDYFLYIGQANKRLYIKYNIPEDKLLPGLYCVDNNRFKVQSDQLLPKRNNIRKQWGIQQDAFCILFSGKFIPKKRPLDIIHAAKQLINEYPNIHLLFIGDGELYNNIKRETNVIFDKEKGIVGTTQQGKLNITFTGFLNQTEITNAYVTADCLILPSDFGETWGLVVNEAMAIGVPAIVSDQCGSSEDLVKPIYPKLVYPMGNIKKLQHATSWLINNQANKSTILGHIKKYSYLSTIKSVISILSNGTK